MKKIKDIPDLDNKKILLRVDFNSVKDDKITGVFRIESHKQTIDYLLDQGAKVCLVSHITKPKDGSFEGVSKKIGEILGRDIYFVGDFEGAKVSTALEENNLILVDNIRRDEREESNDENFAKELAEPFDIYINDAFSVSHRKHVSMYGVGKFLPAYAGFVVEREVENLSKAFKEELRPKVVVIGGSKTLSKSEVIKSFLNLADSVLIGGVVAVNFFKLQGFSVGKFEVDEKALDMIRGIDTDNPKLVLPTDVVISASPDGKAEPFPAGDIDTTHSIYDIGPETVRRFSDLIQHSKLVIWSGAMGLLEKEQFASGTERIAEAIANSDGYSIVGGGDNIAFFEKHGLLDKFDFVSTGGGAMLEFLSGREMPGLDVLNYD